MDEIFNNTYGHQKGDSILKQFGTLLRKISKSGEIVGRYGGEEFSILLFCQHEKAMVRAREVQYEIKTYPFSLDPKNKISITSSLGVSTLHPTDTSHLLIERADKALYLAKKRGRNCVVSEEEIAP